MISSFSGPFTEVLVLGTAHLNADIPDAALQSTIERLTTWRPNVIAVEVLAGEVVDSYIREGGAYDSLQVGYFPTARRIGELTRPFRTWQRAEAERIATQADTEPSERVLAWLIALEPWNALLHWTPSLDLPADIHSALSQLADDLSEVARLALPLARHLDIKRLVHFDDFTSIDLAVPAHDAYFEGIAEADFRQAIEQHPAMMEASAAMQAARQENDLWPLLRYYNSEQGVQDNMDLETGFFLRMPASGGAHQIHLGMWDTRNLFMAARLRMATASVPNGRALAIVGTSHKGPLEAALRALGPDLRFVDLAELEA